MINMNRIKANAFASVRTAAAFQVGNTNLPFDDRMEFSTSPWVPKLIRGWGQSFDTVTRQLGPQRFYFLFNPNEITVTYGAIDNVKADVAQDMTNSVPGAGQRSAISYSFGLMFDRTYEVAYNKDKEGVLRDIEALEKVCHISPNQSFLNSSYVSRWVLGTDLVVYGAVTSIAVKFVNFNKDMVPMRCVVEISIQQRVVPGADLTESLALGGGGGGKTTPTGSKKRKYGKYGKPLGWGSRKAATTTRRTMRGGMRGRW